MDKIYIELYQGSRYQRLSVRDNYSPYKPERLLVGTGMIRRSLDDYEVEENETHFVPEEARRFDRLIYVSAKRHRKQAGILRMSEDESIEEIAIYANSRRGFYRATDTIEGSNPILVDLVILRGGKQGTALNVNTLFEQEMNKMYPEFSHLTKTIEDKYDLYILLYNYYRNKIKKSEKVYFSSFVDAIVEVDIKRNLVNYELSKYFPTVTKSMFKFDGKNRDCYETVRVMIPLTNPDRGTVKLVDIVKKYKKDIFTRVYDKLEEFAGIPKGFFKMDNCTVTCDDCLSFIFSVKDIPNNHKSKEEE